MVFQAEGYLKGGQSISGLRAMFGKASNFEVQREKNGKKKKAKESS